MYRRLSSPTHMPRGVPTHGGQKEAQEGRLPLVLALVLGALERARVRAALRERYQVRFIDRLAEVLPALAAEDWWLSAIILETGDADGRPTLEVARQLCASGTSVPVLAYCRTRQGNAGDARAFVLAGVQELVFAGMDDTGAVLRDLLESASRTLVGERVAKAMMEILPECVGAFVRFVTANPATQRVAKVAEQLGYHRKSLVNHCAEAAVPPPQEMLAWCRLAVAAELLRASPRTIESVALQLNFPSDTSLRNMMKRYTGLPASDVRVLGGARCVLDALIVAIRRHRDEQASA